MVNNSEDMFRIGVIASTHGLKGEVNVFPTTDDVSRFDDLKRCYIKTKKELIEVEKDRVKYFKNMVILGFKEYTDINQVEGFKQCELYVLREDAVPLEEDEFYIADVIDMDVYDDEGNKLGILTDVLQTGANDVFEVQLESGKKILLPVIKDCLLDIDYDNRRCTVHLMKGLID